MAPPADPADAQEPSLDLRRIIQALDRHHVDYVVVGGSAATGYGATRLTADADCVPQRTPQNLTRLAAAMRELGARLDVEGLTDEEAKQLPVQLDAKMLSTHEISTWMTDAGGFDVLADIPGRDGQPLSFDTLNERAEVLDADGVTLRVAGLQDIIASKEWADRPKDREALPELYQLRAAQAAQMARQCFPKPARDAARPAASNPQERPGPTAQPPSREPDTER